MEKIRNELEALYRERYAQFVAMTMTLVGETRQMPMT